MSQYVINIDQHKQLHFEQTQKLPILSCCIMPCLHQCTNNVHTCQEQSKKDFTQESCARFNVTILPSVILAAAPPHPHPREVGLVLVARHLLLLLPPLLRADNLVGNKARGLLNSISGSSRWCRALCVWCSCSLVVETWIRRTSRINCMQRATPSVDLSEGPGQRTLLLYNKFSTSYFPPGLHQVKIPCLHFYT